MNLKLKEERRVESFDADLHNRLKISSIFNYMQDIASKHADRLGVGFHALKEQKTYWVLSWAKVEITGDLPSYGEPVGMETWPKGKHRLYYMRDFLIRNGSGDMIAIATSAWLLINAETKGLNDLAKMGLDLPFFPDDHAVREYPGKFRFEKEMEQHSERKILYSDIDINGHVNNSRYIEFILDCYSQREHEEHTVKSITIAYKGETRFMDRLAINRSAVKDRPGSDYLQAIREDDGKEIFNCLLEWQ